MMIIIVLPARRIVQEWVCGCTIVGTERLQMQVDITRTYFDYTPLIRLE
jgi:hypothetical protein